MSGEDGRVIQLAHGGGGRLTSRLLETTILPALAGAHLRARHDGAVMDVAGGSLAFTTDAFVVKPRVFPGGDIGSLAVHGTVNDLAACGARPRWMSVALVMEEGLPVVELERHLASMRRAADACGVEVVTGDTKVVDHGAGDGLYVVASGVGTIEHALEIAPASIREGDVIVVSGDVGRHGVAILSAREGLRFETEVQSDSAPVHEPVLAMIEAGVAVRCVRDLTRGGLAAALVEIAEASGRRLHADETAVPVIGAVRAACELLGLDPLLVANEGRFVAFVAESDAPRALDVLARHEVSSGAVAVGRVGAAGPGEVTLRTPLGTTRLLDMPSGEQLPRIC